MMPALKKATELAEKGQEQTKVAFFRVPIDCDQVEILQIFSHFKRIVAHIYVERSASPPNLPLHTIDV